MIRQETARAIYNCYAEIKNTEELLARLEEEEKRIEEEQNRVFITEDLSERYPLYELGVPSNYRESRSLRIYHVQPDIAKAAITAHQANQKARLVELNQQAKLELESEEANVTKAS